MSNAPAGSNAAPPAHPGYGEGPALDRPIIIVGAPRSGTTILSKMLQAHHAVVYLEEARLIWRYGNDRKSDMFRPEDARPSVCRHIRRQLVDVSRASGRSRLVEKTPANSLRMAFVDRVLPDAKFIHIIRHGVDSILSIRQFWANHAYGLKGIQKGRVSQRLKEVRVTRLPLYAQEVARRLLPKSMAGLLGHAVWGPRIPGIQSLIRDLDPLEVCALQWRMCVELACQYGRSLPSNRYFECRLEHLTGAKMHEILAFSELDEDAAIGGFFAREFDEDRAGARKGDADPNDVERIMQWIEPTLKWLGYS